MWPVCQKKNRINSRGFSSVLFFFLLATSLFAENNTSVLVDGVYTNAGGRVFVGNTGTNNQLRVVNDGWLDSTKGIIGNKSSARNNFALVEGGSSVWDISGILYVGKDGSVNTLRIRQGGTVYSDSGFLGNGINSTGNAVLLSDANSAWILESVLKVGNKGGTNRLEILNGAKVLNSQATVGQGVASKGNEVLVSGVGSSWANRTNLFVGYYGSENSLVVSNGANVSAKTVFVGVKKGANENRVVVDGTGSLLFATNDFRVGSAGSSNQLMIVNGGRVENAKGVVGFGNKSFQNRVVVSGAGSVWSNRLNLIVGNKQDYNELVVTNGGATFASAAVVGYVKSAKYNKITLTGLDSLLHLEKDLRVGRDGDRNQVFVLNGANAFVGGNLYVGVSDMARNNELFVSGTDSFLQVNKTLFIGNSGSKNRMYIQDGGAVSGSIMRIGVWEDANENAVFVRGADSTFSIRNALSVGYRGAENQMSIDSGARVTAGSLSMGVITSAVNNQISVDGVGTRVVISNSVIVGNHGSANRMVVSDRATVQSKDVLLGRYVDSGNNSIVLSNARWKAGDVSVGRVGGTNTFSLSNFGVLESENTYLGFRSIGNIIDLDGSGTTWSNAFDFVIGANDVATNNIMRIRNGAKLKTRSLAVRSGNGLKLNHSAQVLVTGGTTRSLKGGGQIVIGDTQGNNLISLTEGGEVWSGDVVLGQQAGVDDNVARISGVESRWKATQFVVGASGSGNQLTISDGGVLNAESLMIGQKAGSENNRVSVTGLGSSIQLSDVVDVGLGEGLGNVLSVSDGGRVTSRTTTIHNHATLHLEDGRITSDYVTVDLGGTLSGWGTVAGVSTNAGTIDVGDSSHFLTLNFLDSLVLEDSSEIILDLAGVNNHDKVSAADFLFGGILTVRLANNYTPQVGDTFDLFDWNSTQSQSFSTQNLPALASSLSWDTSKLEITGEIEVVPEPLVVSFIGGVAFLVIVGRRFKKRYFS